MILFRYLSRQVFTSMIAVTLVLLLIFVSGRFIKYLGKAAAGGLSPDVLMGVMAYRMPGFLELILPLGFFIGVLLVYGRMYLESEMTVLHACGMSREKLLGHSLWMAILVAIIVGSLSLFVAPWGMKNVENLFAEQSRKTEFEMLSPGRFQKLSSGSRVTYMEGLSEDKRTMYGVFISESANDEDEVIMTIAESGTQVIDPDTGERYLVLTNGSRQQGQAGSEKFLVMEFDSYGIRIEQPDSERRSVKDEAIPTQELIEQASLENTALLQWRLSLPLLVPIVTLIAVALCRVDARQGRFFHLLPAMLLYVFYLGLLIVARKSVASGGLPPALGLWSVHVAFVVIGLALWNKELIMDLFSKKETV